MSLLIHPTHGPRRSPVGKVHSVAYHRNGVFGEGFYRVEFDHANEGRAGKGVISPRLLAIVTFEGDVPDTKLVQAYVVNPTDGEFAYRDTYAFGPALMAVINGTKWPHEVKSTLST